MSKLFKVKFRKELGPGLKKYYTGDLGHKSALSWEQLVEAISERGIDKVEKLRHDDKSPTDNHKLNEDEILALWKAVAKDNMKKKT